MRQPAIVDEHARRASPHDGRARFHHRASRFQRSARTGQANIDRVAVDFFQLLVRGRLPARRAKNLGKLIVGRHWIETDFSAIPHHQRLGRQPIARGQGFNQLARMRPLSRDAQDNLHRCV